MLPELDGWLLPPGRHAATLGEVYERFVAGAPYRADREPLFHALTWYVRQARRLFWTGAVWIDGGFTTQKPWAPPDDVDLALVVRSAQAKRLGDAERARLHELLTHQVVYTRHPPAFVPRLRTMGGMIDAMLVIRDDPGDVTRMHAAWSSVRGDNGRLVPGAAKGYVEVSW